MGVAETCKSSRWMQIGIGSCCCVVLLAAGVVAVIIFTAVDCAVNVESYANVLVDSSNFGSSVFTLDNMTVLPTPGLYSRLREELFDNWTHEASGYTYGLAGVHEAPMILYNGTKIDGNWEHIPSAVKGVFWMRGNGIPEILATLQYGEWFPEEKILLFPNAPFSWTWYGNATPPTKAAQFNHVYTFVDAQGLAESQGEGNITVAVAFKPCPEQRESSGEGTYCEAGSEDFTFADIQSHSDGNLTRPSLMTSVVTWQMEEDLSAVERHSLWYRRVAVYCDKVGFGSYWLTKIIDENGERIEPHYSEYVAYMEGSPHIIWSGFGPNHHLV